MSLLGFASPFAAPMGAFAGSLVTIVLVTFLAHASLSFETNATILAGIIFTALANAVLSLVLTMVSPNQLQTFFFWCADWFLR